MLSNLLYINSMLDLVLFIVAGIICLSLLLVIGKVANKLLKGILTTIMGLCLLYIVWIVTGSEYFCNLGLCFNFR